MSLWAWLISALRRDPHDDSLNDRASDAAIRANSVSARLEERRRFWDRRANEARRAAEFIERERR